MRVDEPDRPRASRIEILGAWLRLWTPPRDVEVPPVPMAKVAVTAVVLIFAGVLVALAVAPAIDERKDESAAEEQRREDMQRAARRAAQRDEQRVIRGRLTSLSGVEAAIGEDAQRRFGTDGRPADCEPVPGAELPPAQELFDCHVTIREIVSAGEQEGAAGALTIPYRARIETKTGRYAFCKTNPRPGEQALGGPETIVELPKPCRSR